MPPNQMEHFRYLLSVTRQEAIQYSKELFSLISSTVSAAKIASDLTQERYKGHDDRFTVQSLPKFAQPMKVNRKLAVRTSYSRAKTTAVTTTLLHTQ